MAAVFTFVVALAGEKLGRCDVALLVSLDHVRVASRGGAFVVTRARQQKARDQRSVPSTPVESTAPATPARVLPRRGATAVAPRPGKPPAEQAKSEVNTVNTYPDRLTPDAHHRIGEIGEILALGQLRLLDRNTRGKADPTGECSLHFSADQSGHAALRQGAANG